MPEIKELTPNKPTLIIGLGGVGSKIVEGVYRQFDQRNPSDIERRNVQFLCLDTDENDVKDRKKVMPEGSAIKTSSDIATTVGGYIESISKKTTVLDWFDTSSNLLNNMELNKGAAQVRMASRLALMSAIKEGKLEAIDNSITNLLASEPDRAHGNDIRIYIVSSLAGGSGAGSFLQIAYYVRKAMEDHHATACYIEGFFVLADVLCDSTDPRLNDDQKENLRSNTYACMKELVAFCSSDKSEGLREIEFEYRLDQRDKKLPVDNPYNQCYLIDFNDPFGGNLGKAENYYRQVVWSLFMEAFSPTGGQLRSKEINNMRSAIRSDGRKMFSALGASKLIYPVDDLFAYFARRRVSDNMKTSWCAIDKNFDEEYAAYQRDIRDGIPHKEPKRRDFFRNSVDQLSQNSGFQGSEFKQILNSTKILDKDLNVTNTKAKAYFMEVKKEVDGRVEHSEELPKLYDRCRYIDANFTEMDVYSNDCNTISSIEDALKNYWNRTLSFIDSAKRAIAQQCFIDDFENLDFVSKTPEIDKHHLNSVLLVRDNELHPLAVRYFLYDLQVVLEKYLNGEDGKNGKKKANEANQQRIKKYFEEEFDIKETTDVKETAIMALEAKRSGKTGIGNILSGRKPYKEWKEDYKIKSAAQAGRIKTYLNDKLMEEVMSLMLVYVNRMIEESENFFKNLPDSLAQIDDQCEALLKKHDGVTDKDITYVLASSQIKKDIYDFEISQTDSPFFPNVMSAALYRSMYKNVINDLSSVKYKTSKKADEDAKKKAILEANRKILEECVKFQEKIIHEKNQKYATLNVISALYEEGMRENSNDDSKAKEYMKAKFKTFNEQARFWGPSVLSDRDRYINAWGYNPDCIKKSGLTAGEIDELFGEEDITTNHQNAASRLPNDFFSPFEIIRANTVSLLSINEHFKKFHYKESSEYTNEEIGTYYKAYNDVIQRVFETENRSRASVLRNDNDVVKECTVHLDKRWHLPVFMPNIGSTHMVEIQKLFYVLRYGLLLGKFKAEYYGGEYYWKYVGSTRKFIKDINKRMIGIGQTLPNAINILFEKGLVNNPGIVSEMEGVIAEMWKSAKDEWNDTERSETNEFDKMKSHSLVKKILDFKYNLCNTSSFKTNKNWFFILNARRGTTLFQVLEKNDGYLIDDFFDDLANRLLDVFGPCENTKKLCEFIFGKVDGVYKDDYAMRILENKINEGKFEPNE